MDQQAWMWGLTAVLGVAAFAVLGLGVIRWLEALTGQPEDDRELFDDAMRGWIAMRDRTKGRG
jgi:hypothetical protein